MTLRIGTGLATGNDNQAIIEAILTAKAVPVTRLMNDIDKENTILTKWNEIDTKVSALESISSQLSAFTTWNQKSATSSDTTKMTAMAGTSNSAVAGTYALNITSLASSDQYKSNVQTSATSALGLGGVFTINGQDITVTSDNSLTDIMNKVNSVSGDMTKKVNAYIVNTTLFFKSADTGTSNAMSITDTSGTVLSTLGVTGVPANHTAATNLAGTVEGVTVSSQSNTGITSFISGVTLNFKGTGNTTLTLDNDKETIKSLLDTFISDYNDLNDYMKAIQSVKTNDQGDSVTSIGYLQGDLLANSLQTRIAGLFSAEISNSAHINPDFNSFRKLGIYVKSDTNQLAIADANALDSALTSNFDDVKNLFRLTDPDTGKVVGVMKNLDSYLYAQTDPIQGTISQRKLDIQSTISTKQSRVVDLNEQLANEENLLFEHFSSSESMISTWSSQLTYLTNTLGG